MAVIPINFDDFLTGSILPTGLYDSAANLHLGAETSPFIEVKVGVSYSIEIRYIVDKLTNTSNPWSWARFYAYDNDYNPLYAVFNYTEALSSKLFSTTFKIKENVKYIRFCSSHIAHDGVIVNINSDEPEPEIDETDENIILSIKSNGDLQIFNKDLIQGQGYSFSKQSIKVPIVFEKNNSTDDNCVFSLRRQCLFLKGEIIGRGK